MDSYKMNEKNSFNLGIKIRKPKKINTCIDGDIFGIITLILGNIKINEKQDIIIDNNKKDELIRKMTLIIKTIGIKKNQKKKQIKIVNQKLMI